MGFVGLVSTVHEVGVVVSEGQGVAILAVAIKKRKRFQTLFLSTRKAEQKGRPVQCPNCDVDFPDLPAQLPDVSRFGVRQGAERSFLVQILRWVGCQMQPFSTLPRRGGPPRSIAAPVPFLGSSSAVPFSVPKGATAQTTHTNDPWRS
jgi:hypothetical protein